MIVDESLCLGNLFLLVGRWVGLAAFLEIMISVRSIPFCAAGF